MLLRIGEVFGHSIDDNDARAWRQREAKWCPFRDAPCNKGNRNDPLGICSFADETHVTTVCPARFLENNQIFKDAGGLAFGPKARIAAIPEIRVLTVPGEKPKKIGKIDYMLARLDEEGVPSDFAALEIQSVYISGASIKPDFHTYLKERVLPETARRRPDFRSSAQKRLMPQLSLKVPIFRRWGRKFFVAVDDTFFGSLPRMKEVKGIENSEVTWLVYSFSRAGKQIAMMPNPQVVYTHWDEVVAALREGEAPKPQEMLAELAGKVSRARLIET